MALLKRKRSGLADPMTVVTNFVNACNRHDAEGVSACLHPDFDSIQPMYPSRNFRGADQVRRNWQAIFDAEPGFRLTVLRSAGAGDTVWLELHGAGRDAEVAGVFVMGILGDRIRWARIYSALVEDAPAASGADAPATPVPLRQVPPLEDDDVATDEAATEAPAAADEESIAPVVDIDGNGRSRRGRSRWRADDQPDAVAAEPDPVVDEAAAALSAPTEAAAQPGPSDPDAAVAAGEPSAWAEPAPAEPDIHAGADSAFDTGHEFGPGPSAEDAIDTEPEPVAASPEPDVLVETMVEVDPKVVVEADEPAPDEPQFFLEPARDEPAEEPAAPLPPAPPGLIVTTPPPAPPPGGPEPDKGRKRWRG